MIEYIYDALKVTAGQGFTVGAQITDDDGELIRSGCYMTIYNDEEMFVKVNGIFDGTAWNFQVPAEAVQGLEGRFWYCISHLGSDISFKQPLYFM